jgi:hypothetical protein
LKRQRVEGSEQIGILKTFGQGFVLRGRIQMRLDYLSTVWRGIASLFTKNVRAFRQITE